ncbi:MAG: OsmC family protein [Calothrix sp. SM1_5_4]|nr:OsmC family protein [Calothrix sp. SM1_5_4]
MQVILKWEEGMAFMGRANGNGVRMDAKAPLGRNSGPTPKELVAMGLGGCTAMDVIALLKKNKQLPESFDVTVDIVASSDRAPVVFDEALITFSVNGNVQAETLLDSVHRSQTQYCGVSAMLAKAHPIRYRVELNGAVIGEGQARFE